MLHYNPDNAEYSRSVVLESSAKSCPGNWTWFDRRLKNYGIPTWVIGTHCYQDGNILTTMNICKTSDGLDMT